MSKKLWQPSLERQKDANIMRFIALCNREAESVAILFHNEQGQSKQYSYLTFYQKVSQLAQALAADGIIKGDRVIAVLPNIPETVIAMLAATSLGAIWSSCSPDFAVETVSDRFIQTKPKVLFVSDSYYFNGHVFDRSDQIELLLSHLESVTTAYWFLISTKLILIILNR
ncbi:MAG: AMP-binding protein [Methylococcales symbiont of Hymedesmia sp. n. MRB-2018]|nr:MAG: AMP-binding protein [Methylococcales symbiont of Hymedesmia sp. n. MRB-2018]